MADQPFPFAQRGSTGEVEEGLAFAPKFDADGLITCVTTDARSGEVLTASLAAANPQPAQAPAQAQAPSGQPATAADLAAAARDHLRAAEAAAGKGDWTTYGTEMASVHQLLDQLAAAAGR